MNFLWVRIGTISFILAICLFALTTSAQGIPTTLEVVIPGNVTASVRCNNQNFNHSIRCQSPVDVNTFRMIGEAHFEGFLLSGVYFEQYPIAKTFSKFVAEDAFWYIDASGTFEAKDDLQALSIHLAR